MGSQPPPMQSVVVPGLFGLSGMRAKDLAERHLLPALHAGDAARLGELLDQLGDSAQCVARPLLRGLYRRLEQHYLKDPNRWDAVLKKTLSYSLPQKEVLHFLWRCIVDPDCSSKQLRAVCQQQSDLLQLHMDLSYCNTGALPEVRGFSLQLAASSSLARGAEEECKTKMEVLLAAGARVDARLQEEESAVHVAAKFGAWSVVRLLLDHGADIDLNVGGSTARVLIAQQKPEWIASHPKSAPVQESMSDRLYSSLHAGDEQGFAQLLSSTTVDVNCHDGRDTMLQLAVLQKLPQACQALIDAGADVNLCAGNSTPPIILALNDPEFTCLSIFSKHISKLNLKFSYDDGTFLNHMSVECTRRENLKDFRLEFAALIEEAIRQKVHIGAKDEFGTTALEVLSFGSHADPTLFHLLLERGGFLTIDENLVLDTRPEVFTAFLDSQSRIPLEYRRGKDSVPWANRFETIEVDYDFLEPLESDRSSVRAAEMLPFFELCKSEEHKKVLLHPVISLFLIYKWRKIAFVYLFNFFLYVSFTASYSVYIFQLTNFNETDSDNVSGIIDSEVGFNDFNSLRYSNLFAITVFFWCLILCRELFQAVISTSNYIRNSENYFEILLLIFSLLTFLEEFHEYKFIAAGAIVLTYVELTLLIGRHPYTGTYITMFTRVSLKSIQLLLIFSSFIFAFAFGFHVVFNEFYTEESFFNSLWHSVLRTSGMAAGELGLDSLKFDKSPVTSEVVFLLFLIFVPVVLMNLLNALAVSDTQQVIDEAALLCCVANIKHYTKIESMWLGYSLDCPSGDRSYGFSPVAYGKVLALLRSFFSVNVLPFPENPYTNPGPTSTLKIHLEQKHYYPHVYFTYKDAPSTFYSYTVYRAPHGLIDYVRYFYYRVLLRGNEDAAVRELRPLKYPNLDTDMTEVVRRMERSVCQEMGERTAGLGDALSVALEKLGQSQRSAIAVAEENIKSRVRVESVQSLGCVERRLAAQESALAELRRQQGEVGARVDELKASVLQVSQELKEVLAAVRGLSHTV